MRMYLILTDLGLAVLCGKSTELTCRAMSVAAVCLRVKAGFSWYHCGGAQGQKLVLSGWQLWLAGDEHSVPSSGF